MRVGLLLLVLLWTAQSMAAAPNCDKATTDCVEVGQWQLAVSIGAGVRTNPIMDNKDIPLVVLPEIAYNGQRFFIQNLDFGYILAETDRQQLSLLLTPSYEQVYFHRWSPGNFILDSHALLATSNELQYKNTVAPNRNNFGESRTAIDMSQLHKRRMAALGGVEYTVTWSDWMVQAHWLEDVSKVHQGTELRVALARHFRYQRHRVSASLGANWQSADLINYYYGIRTDEVAFADHAYYADAGVSAIARLDWRYLLNEHWSLRFTGIYRHLAEEISRSPIVTDDEVVTVFVGGVYHF